MSIRINKLVRGAFFASVALSVSACSVASNTQAGTGSGMNMDNMAYVHGSASTGGQEIALPSVQNTQMQALANSNNILQVQNKILADMDSMRERMRRVERAMIRLDRRMKLVEKNELSRMSGLEPAAGSDSGSASLRQMSHTEPQIAPTRTPQHYGVISSPFARGVSASQTERAGFKTVSHVNSTVIGSPSAAGKAAIGVKTVSELPSLADKDEPAGLPNGGVQIWTVTYQPNKVWPSREQLAGALDMLDSLKSGKKVTLFARAQKTSSDMFKDRLKAIGRYLSDVAEVDELPIASMPAQHLPSDTIEIIATQ